MPRGVGSIPYVEALVLRIIMIPLLIAVLFILFIIIILFILNLVIAKPILQQNTFGKQVLGGFFLLFTYFPLIIQ